MSETRKWIVIAFFAVMISGAASAQELSAEQTEALLFQGPWKVQTGGEHNYFLWRPDGRLCVKMYQADAEACEDDGTWTVKQDQVCYELQWWGKAEDLHALCFRVKATSEDYEAIDALGLPVLRFTVTQSQ